MNPDKNYKKDLTYKGNSVKRLIKEYESYAKECETLTAKLNELKNNNAEEYDINKHNEFVTESESAKSQTKKSLMNYTNELTLLVNEIQDDEIKALEAYAKAQEYLNKVAEMFSDDK